MLKMQNIYYVHWQYIEINSKTILDTFLEIDCQNFFKNDRIWTYSKTIQMLRKSHEWKNLTVFYMSLPSFRKIGYLAADLNLDGLLSSMCKFNGEWCAIWVSNIFNVNKITNKAGKKYNNVDLF